MAEFAIALNMRKLDGTLILALEDEANGYWVRSGGMPSEDEPLIRRTTRHPNVDGASNDWATKDQNDNSVLVKVFGSTWAQTQQRLKALKDAAPIGDWLLEQVIEGVTTTWRCGPVEVLPANPTPVDYRNKRRFVALAFPTQPNPTITFPEEH
jgi:hypothetical protein